MGNTLSGHATTNVFEKELEKLNSIVNDIINEKDIFKNNDYNFLEQDVCKNFQVVLEEELSKYLKIEIKELGASLFVIPKNDDETKLTKLNLTKKQVCDKISNHYIKVLYIMCLVKYVYNLEKSGDLSIAGIIFRNIKIVDDMMQIYFCGLPHKNYTNTSKEGYKIDFSKLEGLKFFTEFFLTPEESKTFMGILREILARSSSTKVGNEICEYIQVHGKKDFKELEALYLSRFQEKSLSCTKKVQPQKGGENLSLFIAKDNPVFLADYCGAPIKLVVKLDTKEGKDLMQYYKKMKTNYNKNVKDIHVNISKLVYKSPLGKFELRDIDKPSLDVIIDDVKLKVKIFFMQSIFDFQTLLDIAKSTPNIHIT
jgi:hypothetical protein